MWRLMYAMIVVSDGGAIAVDSHHTDWPTQQACDYAAKTLYTIPPEATINGVRLTMKTNVQCVPVDMPMETAYAPPPLRHRLPPPPPPPGFPGVTFGPGGVRFGPF